MFTEFLINIIMIALFPVAIVAAYYVLKYLLMFIIFAIRLIIDDIK